jgi:hypothetical protein
MWRVTFRRHRQARVSVNERTLKLARAHDGKRIGTRDTAPNRLIYRARP